MTDEEIAQALPMLLFMEPTDAWTQTLANYQWALIEVVRLREYRRAVLAARDNYRPSSQPEMDLDELFAAIGAGEDR